MSGSSYDSTCPRCGGVMECYSDWKPIDMVEGHCLECGFSYRTVASMASLSEVNELREAREMEPLNALRSPSQEWLDAGWEQLLTTPTT